MEPIKAWNGKLIADMTRDEIIVVLNEVAAIIVETRMRLQEVRGK